MSPRGGHQALLAEDEMGEERLLPRFRAPLRQDYHGGGLAPPPRWPRAAGAVPWPLGREHLLQAPASYHRIRGASSAGAGCTGAAQLGTPAHRPKSHNSLKPGPGPPSSPPEQGTLHGPGKMTRRSRATQVGGKATCPQPRVGARRTGCLELATLPLLWSQAAATPPFGGGQSSHQSPGMGLYTQVGSRALPIL